MTAVGTRRVAVVQAAAVAFDAASGVHQVREHARRAADDGCELVLFPEAFLGGYPRGLDFGTTVGHRTEEGREWFRRYHAGAVDVPGPIVDELEQIAAETGIVLVVGIIERAGGTLYCAVVIVDPADGLVGHRRKLMPTGAERLVWGMGDLRRSPVFPTRLAAVGAVICWENYMPLLRAYAYSEGVQIWCAPTADAREGWEATLRHIALEGRCFVLSANQYARRSDYPEDYPISAEPDTVLCDGASMIVSPSGEILAGPGRSGPAMLVADLDLADTVRGAFDFDVVGHYARADLFTLTVRAGADRVVQLATEPEPPTDVEA